jgi:hypothetical protein
MMRRDAGSHVPDAIGVADGSAAVFLDEKSHGRVEN